MHSSAGEVKLRLQGEWVKVKKKCVAYIVLLPRISRVEFHLQRNYGTLSLSRIMRPC